MTVGVSVTNVANEMLDWLRGVAPTAVPAMWMQIHTGDPGAVGADNVSVVTTRMQITMSAAANGVISLSTVSGSWSMTATEAITHMSVHTASTAGNFLFSGVLTIVRNVDSGDTLTVNSMTVDIDPLAA